MITFQLITEHRQVVAVILDDTPAPSQLTTLYALLPANAQSFPDLAQRWNVSHVLSTWEWAGEQRHRIPMLRPSGSRLAILAILFSAFQLFSFSAFPASLPTHGSGAADLIRRPAAPSVPSLPSLPSLPLVAPEPLTTNTWFFAATAVDTDGLESDYSDELIWSTAEDFPGVALAWDPSPGTRHIACYQIYTGVASRTYTNKVSAGTNTTLALQLVPLPPPPLTNILLTITTTSATNLQWSLSPRGPWTLLNATNWLATNPPAPKYFRPIGRSRNHPGTATIKATQF